MLLSCLKINIYLMGRVKDTRGEKFSYKHSAKHVSSLHFLLGPPVFDQNHTDLS